MEGGVGGFILGLVVDGIGDGMMSEPDGEKD